MDKEDKVKEIQTLGETFIVSNHRDKKEYAIFEQVFPPTDMGEPSPAFAYYEQSGHLDIKNSVTKSGNEVWIPIKKYPFAKVQGVENYENIDTLYQNIYDFIRDYIDFTDDAFYHIFTAFVISSWRLEDFDSIPYLMFLGEFASGKTRCLEVLRELCYRAIKTSSVTSAAVVRLLERYRVTLLVDETDTLNNESKFELVAILNSGYKIDDYYIRAKSETNDDNIDLEFWRTYGLKALAGTEDFVKTLNSRCIEIPMERARRKIRKKVDKEKALQLRSRLLDYRFKNVFVKLPDIDLPFENGRNHELFTPLVQVVPEKFRKFVIDYGLKLEAKRKVEDATSFEGDILRSVLELVKEGKTRIYSRDVFEKYVKIHEDDEPTLRNEANKTKNKIGRILNNKFHLEKTTDYGFVVNKNALYRHMLRYAPELDSKREEYFGKNFVPEVPLDASEFTSKSESEESPKSQKSQNSDTNEIGDLGDLGNSRGGSE